MAGALESDSSITVNVQSTRQDSDRNNLLAWLPRRRRSAPSTAAGADEKSDGKDPNRLCSRQNRYVVLLSVLGVGALMATVTVHTRAQMHDNDNDNIIIVIAIVFVFE